MPINTGNCSVILGTKVCRTFFRDPRNGFQIKVENPQKIERKHRKGEIEMLRKFPR